MADFEATQGLLGGRRDLVSVVAGVIWGLFLGGCGAVGHGAPFLMAVLRACSEHGDAPTVQIPYRLC